MDTSQPTLSIHNEPLYPLEIQELTESDVLEVQTALLYWWEWDAFCLGELRIDRHTDRGLFFLALEETLVYLSCGNGRV